jgi:hypothetical protein
MATFSNSLRHVKAHLAELVPEQQIFHICRELAHTWRKRTLDPAVTVQLFLLQLLAKVALGGLRHAAQIPVSASAICQACQRLPLRLFMELVGRCLPKLTQPSLWKGMMIFLADGMSFMTPDTPTLAGRFGKPQNQRGASYGYPAPKLLALMDLTGGFIAKVIALPWARHELSCLSRLFGAVLAAAGEHAALLLGDRGLVSFAHLALLTRAGIHGCFRLPRWQVVFARGKGSRRLIKRLGPQDLLVRWNACRRPAWLSQKRWQPLSKTELTLRQIAFRVCRKGFRTHWAWIITTLSDPRQYPAPELIKLYGKRWQIEVYFRDLKQTLGMKMLSARTVTGVQKEILAFVLLYNLIRRVMQQAARRQEVLPDRISFIDALRWLLWSSPGQTLGKLKVNRLRLRRSPPRRLKNARHRFPQLNATRAQLSKPPCCVML